MTFSASSTVWQVRPVGGRRYRVEFCCRGGPAGAFDVVLTPWLCESAGRVLGAAGVLLDTLLPLGLPAEVDLETAVRADPGLLRELRRRLGEAVPQPAGWLAAVLPGSRRA
ncbi:hypothetical protein [Amycolatopsis sp. CA-128772]|uniref:hypothetical protein n=1 Tax=Amycolatopsis sp. CA-128772 TaxID=2073159 RepID=UPI000CD04B7C|nr:hypothetical protein [Amycolatopsis sp. CA-128772]